MNTDLHVVVPNTMADSIAVQVYPEYIDKIFLKKIIENGLKCKDPEVQEFTVAAMSCGSGENYCSDIYEVNVKFKVKGLELQEEHLIVKSIAEQKITTLKQLDIFGREKYFYECLVPQLEALWRCPDRQWIMGPKLWYATSNPIDTLVMDNLVPLGYQLKSRQEGLNMAHSIMVLQKLAEYHALSYVLAQDKGKLSTLTDRYGFGLVNKVSCKSKAFQALFKTQLESFVEVLQEDVSFGEICKKLQEYCENFEEKVTACIDPLQGQVNVLNHGDVWVNNLLFRYTSNGQRPLEVKFIDFQLSFYGSLGYDVNYFLSTSIQLATLRDHRQTLIDAYVQAFLNTLHGLPNFKDPPTVQQIHQEIHSKEPYGFFVAYAFLPLMTMNPDDSQDNSLENFNDPQFAKRKMALMFSNKSRALSILKYTVKRLFTLGVL